MKCVCKVRKEIEKNLHVTQQQQFYSIQCSVLTLLWVRSIIDI